MINVLIFDTYTEALEYIAKIKTKEPCLCHCGNPINLDEGHAVIGYSSFFCDDCWNKIKEDK